ncbi:hypothetical protein [Natrinema sp. SYSU A 869]|uniref:hypothetical protein n=1 Tax=Natrinema sp. SYSU A 869 TaxID=2871694 RepID=UPI002103CCAF|nr:hypothetical protein [Natrinema sp. SYSU A 869]
MSVQTADLESAAEAIDGHPTVRDVRVVDHARNSDPRTLEIVLLPEVDRIPPAFS